MVVENYPQLKSNENFNRLMDELSGPRTASPSHAAAPVVGILADGRRIEADEILLAWVGQRPRTGDLGLDAGRAGTRPRGAVDDQLPRGRGGWGLALRGRRHERPLAAHPHGEVPGPRRADVMLGKPGTAWADHPRLPPRHVHRSADRRHQGSPSARRVTATGAVRVVTYGTGDVAQGSFGRCVGWKKGTSAAGGRQPGG